MISLQNYAWVWKGFLEISIFFLFHNSSMAFSNKCISSFKAVESSFSWCNQSFLGGGLKLPS